MIKISKYEEWNNKGQYLIIFKQAVQLKSEMLTESWATGHTTYMYLLN